MTVYRGRIQLLAKPASEWTAANPVLLNGEVGVSDPATSAPILKVGDGVRPWSTLPAISGAGGGAANYVVGSTTTLAPGAFATVTIDNSVSPPTISFGIPTGAPGPANTLAIGTVTTGALGDPAAATITGAAPNQTLNLTLPMGPRGPQGFDGVDGATGPTGPSNVLTIGTVTTGAPGSAAAASITGTSPAQVLNLTIPTGETGPQGIPGPVGPEGPQGPAGDASGMAGADTHVTGDWVFDPTQFFGFTTAEVAQIKANANLWSVDDAYHANVRTRLARVGNTHSIQFQRVNGSYGAPTGILAGEPVGLIAFGGMNSAGALTTPARVAVWSNEAWSGSATGAEFRFEATPAGSIARTTVLTVRGNSVEMFVPVIGTGGTWTDVHNFYSSTGATPVFIHGASADWACKISNDGAIPYGLLITAGASASGVAALYVRSADATPNNYLIIQANGFSFGNVVNNPPFTFLGTGASSWAGVMTIAVATGRPLTISSGDTGRVLDIGGGSASGPYATWLRSGTPFADMGNAAQLGGGAGALDGFGIATRGATPIIFSHDGGTEGVRVMGQGGLQITGTYSGATGTRAAAGIEIAIGGTGTVAVVVCYNRATSAYLPLQLNCTSVDVSGPGNSAIKLNDHAALSDFGDGFLRLNNDGAYGNGVYSPGQIRSSTWMVAEDGLRNSANTYQLRINQGLLPYGTFYVTGASTGGFHGLSLDDGGLRPTFMSNNASYGIHCNGDSKWLVIRNSSISASSYYNFDAPSFTTTSSRAIKRETGKPSQVREILKRLRPVLYRLLVDDDREQLGFIAEEVHEVCPQLSDGRTVAYDRLALLLLADWQDQHATA